MANYPRLAKAELPKDFSALWPQTELSVEGCTSESALIPGVKGNSIPIRWVPIVLERGPTGGTEREGKM
jgi:hypothetical protein